MEKLKKKLSNKWLLSFLAIFMFISSIFTSFFIVGYSDLTSDVNIPNIQFTSNGGSWNYDSSTSILEGSISGKDGGACSSDSSQTASLTITYKGNSKATLSFDYELSLNSGSCSIDNTNVTSNGSFKKDLNQNNSFDISITSGKGSSSTTKIFLKNFNKAEEVTVTFNLLTPENGIYSYSDSVNNVNVINDTVITTSGNEYFTLNATPNDGYEFYAWYFNEKIQSTKNPYIATFTENANIYPKFIIKDSAVFKNNNSLFFNLDDALTSAENSSDKTIVLVKSGNIQGGESEEQKKVYTISSGITLLIPNDSSYSMYKSEANYISYTKPTLYSELVIGAYTNILCQSNASIYVGSSGSYTMGSNGSPSGPYGLISLNDDTSMITLESGSYLYAYGYISGNGTIIAKNGSHIKEFFQFTDWRGGQVSLLLATGSKLGIGSTPNRQKVFLFSQYYIQNIECNLIFNYGSIETIMTSADVMSVRTAEADFITTSGSSSSGMFKLKSNSTLERKYIGESDRIEYTLSNGSADLSSIVIDPGVEIDSNDYVLPINSNITITIKTGTTMNINQDIAMLPGSKLTVEEGATVNIANGVSIYCYDKTTWNGNGFVNSNKNVSPIKYTTINGTTVKRGNDSLEDSLIDINGTINVSNGGGIYSTFTNANDLNGKVANIISSKGTGNIVYNGEPGNSTTNNSIYTTYQYKQVSTDGEFISITVSHPILRNQQDVENENYTYLNLGQSSSSLADVNVVYDNTIKEWKITTKNQSTFNITFINEKNSTDIFKTTYEDGEIFTFPTNSITQFEYNNFELKKWFIPELGFFNPGESTTLNLGRDIEVYAIWGGWVNYNGYYYYIDYNTGEFLNGLKRVEHYSENKTYIMKFDNGIFDIGYTGIYYDSNYNKNYYVASGIVQENSGLIKYTTNITTLSFEYIFIQSDNSLLTSGRYYIDTNLNSLLPSGYYNFDSNGYIIRDDTEITDSNGQIYIKDNFTYIDGIKVSYGLFVYNNNLYYSNTNCEIVRNTTFYVSKTNNLGINEGLYYFDEEGRMYDQNFNLIEVK